MISSLPALLEARARRHPERPAILGLGSPPLTYAALYEHVVRTATALRGAGMASNQRVALVMPNGPEMAKAFLSVASVATCAPLNPGYRAGEFDFYLSDLDAKALVVEAGSTSPAVGAARSRGLPVIETQPLEAVPAGVFAGEGDTALVLHTSGTTSRPKIVPLTHANLCTSARNVAASLALTEEDRCLNVMPLFHIHGLVASLLASLWAGASVVCTPGFDAPRFLDWMAATKPTWYTAVPTMHQSILGQASKVPELRHPLRLIRSSSAALPPQVMARLEEVFRAPVIEAYGMTEAAHQIASNPLPPARRKAGIVGLAAGPDIAINDGEVVLRGPNVTRGYDNNPEANAAAFFDGWFRTGDLGTIDSDGYLTLTGRLKEIINRGGEKISPREVEEAIMDHPAVEQVVVFAVPDPSLGESVGAAIVLRDGQPPTAAEIRRFAAARLTDFKVPGTILFVGEIPKGPTEKLQRIGLAGRLGLPSHAGAAPAKPHMEPQSAIEKLVAAIWAEVLRIEQVGLHDDFLDLGGDSMLAMQVVSRIRDQLEVELTVASFFDASTVEDQAGIIENLLVREAPADPS